MRLLTTLLIFALAAVPTPATSQPRTDPLAQVASLAGDWVGVGEGEPGISSATRHGERVHEGNYIRIEGRSVYPKQDANKKGEIHTQTDWWSYDRARKRLVLRQFDNLGFVSTYVEDPAASRPGHLVLLSENLENVPTGWRARYTYDFKSDGEYEERFELDPTGKGFQIYTFNRFLKLPTD